TASDGHVVDVPLQFSSWSQAPTEIRQTKPGGSNRSGGQSLLTPSQLSATSQVPDAGRQTPVCLPSTGHAAVDPSQFSAGSHPPADARHCVPALPGACWQTLLDPLQRSVVQTLPSSVQAVPFVLNVHVDVQHEPVVPLAEPVSHCSGLSTTPSPQSEK